MLRQPRDKRIKNAVEVKAPYHDTISILKNVPNNNGRVRNIRHGYGGWLTVMGMLDASGMKAVVHQASPADMWLGDDFHHNGTFRLSYRF